MEFQLLVIPNCPHQAAALNLFRSSLAPVSIKDDPSITVIADAATAERFHFTGSPSFFADGHDLLPDGRVPGIACRLYTADRKLSGLPDQQTLEDAIQKVVAASS